MSIFTTFETDNFIEIFDAAGTGVVAARVHGVSVGSETMAISIFRHLEKKNHVRVLEQKGNLTVR